VSGAQVIETDTGTITVPPAVLARIVVRSAEQVDGARVRSRRRPRGQSPHGLWTASQAMPWRKGVEVEVADGRVRVSLELAVRIGLVLPDVAREVQERVGESLRRICGLEPEAVDVAVEELEG
jgi:uncharacterized alkaline shock family protein YloU